MMKRLLSAFFILLLASSGLQAQIVNTLPFTLQNNTTADATQVMADLSQIVNNVNSNAAKNGSNSDITALTALSTPLTTAQGGSTVYIGGTSTGTANAQVVATPAPSGFTLTAGKRIVFIASASNTAATTINIAGTGVINVYKLVPSGISALTGGEIRSGAIVEAVYDGTQYQLITNNLSVLGPLTNLASATTTDLGTVISHNATITGVTTITGFGSSASTDFPIYYLKFSGALTLTHNGTSLILPGAANIPTATGDAAIALYLGSGNWQVLFYQPASGKSVVPFYPIDTDGTLTANSDTVVASQKATKTYATAHGQVQARGTFYYDSPTLITKGLSGVTSIVRNAQGQYTVTLSAALPDTAYQVVFSNPRQATGSTGLVICADEDTKTTTTFVIVTSTTGALLADAGDIKNRVNFAVIR